MHLTCSIIIWSYKSQFFWPLSFFLAALSSFWVAIIFLVALSSFLVALKVLSRSQDFLVVWFSGHNCGLKRLCILSPSVRTKATNPRWLWHCGQDLEHRPQCTWACISCISYTYVLSWAVCNTWQPINHICVSSSWPWQSHVTHQASAFVCVYTCTHMYTNLCHQPHMKVRSSCITLYTCIHITYVCFFCHRHFIQSD